MFKSFKLTAVDVGVFLTSFYIAILSQYIYHNFSYLGSLGANGVGDFLAGTISPIAFIWLIFGYLLQGREFKENTEALTLQLQEMARSNELALENRKQAQAQHEVNLKIKNAELESAEIERFLSIRKETSELTYEVRVLLLDLAEKQIKALNFLVSEPPTSIISRYDNILNELKSMIRTLEKTNSTLEEIKKYSDFKAFNELHNLTLVIDYLCMSRIDLDSAKELRAKLDKLIK
ncbi:hypothetical protein [Marivivens donghaensis]|jgi:hypothetical protein|uniref:hypothetical protein n=1 Tax=Marivivens donghaensis TaxID=1699413 RepID=UPI003F6A4DCD